MKINRLNICQKKCKRKWLVEKTILMPSSVSADYKSRFNSTALDLKAEKPLTHSQFELREARAPSHRTSRRIHALLDEHAQMELTTESLYRINTYYASLNKVLCELEVRFGGNYQEILRALGDICHRETPDKESFFHITEFYKINGEILEAEQKMCVSLSRERGFHSMERSI